MTQHAWGDQPGPSYGGPPPPRREAPVGLAVAAGVLAIGVTLLQVLSAIAAVPAGREFEDAVRAGGSTDDVLTWYDGTVLLFVPAILAMYVVGCLWLQAARTNAEVISPGMPHARSKVWVWLGWWVPIVSLWFPFQVVRDVENGSRRQGPPLGLGLWWAGWLVWLFANRAAARVASSADPDTVSTLPTIEAIGAVALVAACVQWCRLLHRITTDQGAALAGRAYS